MMLGVSSDFDYSMSIDLPSAQVNPRVPRVNITYQTASRGTRRVAPLVRPFVFQRDDARQTTCGVPHLNMNYWH
jgi:hypothetical protein